MKNKFLKLSVWLTAAMILAGTSCKGKEVPVKEPDTPSLSVTPEVKDIVFAADGKSAVMDGETVYTPGFKVETNQGEWEVTKTKPWVEIKTLGADQFILTAEPVTGVIPPESAEITVRAGDATPVMMRVQQFGADPALFVTPEYRDLVLSLNGETAWYGIHSFQPVFSVFANTADWDVQSDHSWLTIVQDKEKNTFTLTCDANAGAGPFANAKITVTSEGAFPVIISVTHILTSLKPPYPPSHVVMNVRRDPKTQMAFNWLTAPDAFTGRVEIVQGTATAHHVFATPYKTVHATADNITNLQYTASENRSYVMNKALAEDLTPGTTYSYRAGYDGSWSDIGAFTTAGDASDFTFLYVTDMQASTTSNFQIAARAVRTAYNRFPNVKFLMSCGDHVDDGNSAWAWEQFFTENREVFYKLPFAPVMGNHDSYLFNSFVYYFNTEPARLYGTSPTRPGSVYSFVYGDVLFLALNTEESNRTALGNWMRTEVNRPEHAHVRWRIAFFHKCMYSGGSYQPSSENQTIRDALAPVFDELDIDIAFQGHEHIYQVIGPVYGKELVPGAVANVTSTTPSHPYNSTGKSGGRYNVQKGTLYFMNASAQNNQRNANNPLLEGYGVPNYPSLFTGRLGRLSGSPPIYSHVSVTRDEITITSYSVPAAGSSVLFDEIKVVKPN